MRARGAVYAYHGLFEDDSFVTVGLNSFTESYMRARGLQWRNPELHALQQSRYENPALALQFATNLEALDMTRYRQPDIAAFVDAIIEGNYIFRHRWGDAPIRSAMLRVSNASENE
jgi:hypothetical protein